MEPETSLETAIARLAADGFIAYPTETVWGLGACADRPVAIERLRAWKGRSEDMPLAVLVSSADAARKLGCRFDPRAMRLARAFWPGPLMLIVPCERSLAPGVARRDGALGLRCSSHVLARRLTKAIGEAGLGPLTSTSLNRSGARPAASLAEAKAMAGVAEGCDLESPLVLPGPDSETGHSAPSSIVDCTEVTPRILREGAIDRASLESVWADRPERSID